MEDSNKNGESGKRRKSLKDKEIGMVKYGVPDKVLDQKETKKVGDVVGTRNSDKNLPKE